MNKNLLGILSGIGAGVLDVIPMLLQGITWDANLSAFSLWVVSGFLIATSRLSLQPCLKGIVISLMILTPCAILIAWNDPTVLVPILVMTVILGAILGWVIEKFGR